MYLTRYQTWDTSLAVWRELAAALARTEVAGETSLRARIDQWDGAVDGALDAIDPRELETLSSVALAGAGCVVARSLERHGLRLDGHAARLRALRVSWEGLRSYLNNPWMDASLSGSGDYRQRIAGAIIEGNLESVLDEHLWVTGTLRYLDAEALAAHLGTALSLRTSDVKLYGLDGRDFNLRAHAALAFTQAVRRHTPDTDEDADPSVRTDDLRVAFNSGSTTSARTPRRPDRADLAGEQPPPATSLHSPRGSRRRGSSGYRSEPAPRCPLGTRVVACPPWPDSSARWATTPCAPAAAAAGRHRRTSAFRRSTGFRPG